MPSLTAEVNVTVLIEDKNDNKPVFQSAPYIAQIQEDVVFGTQVGIFLHCKPV